MTAQRSDAPKGRIGKQIVLPFSKVIEISYKSLRVRFWRSIITTSGVILAIGFLMSVVSTRAMTRSLEDANDPAINVHLQKMGIAQGAMASLERKIETLKEKGTDDAAAARKLAAVQAQLDARKEDAARERQRGNTRDTWLVSMASKSARASSAGSTGVLPVLTTCLGPRTACAGLKGTTWPSTR